MTKGNRGRNHRPWSSGFKGVVKSTRPRVSDSGLRAGTLVNVKELKVSLSKGSAQHRAIGSTLKEEGADYRVWNECNIRG